jgi:hypothetical protein
MSITGVTQYADGLGECSALAAMQTLGVTTGRISNDAYASLVDIQTPAIQTLTISSLQAVNTFIPSFLSNFCWIYVQVRVTSSNPLVLGEYIDLRASFMGYDLQYPIYPVSGPSPTNYQCGPFLRTFRFGRVDSIAPIAVVYAGISSSIARSLEIRSVFVQTL